jgi:hypothetical protein
MDLKQWHEARERAATRDTVKVINRQKNIMGNGALVDSQLSSLMMVMETLHN